MMEKPNLMPNPPKANKGPLQVVIITQHYRVEGEVHINPGGRLTDFLNTGDNVFIAVTNAKLYNLLEKESVYAVNFLAINRSCITMAFPMTRPE